MPSPLSKRLQMLPDVVHLVLNAPDGLAALLGDRPDRAELADDIAAAPEGGFGWTMLFVKSMADLNALVPTARDATVYDGRFWLCYPKKSSKVESDLDRDIIWEAMKAHNLAPVRQVSVDATWSALRFRPPEKVGS